MNESACRTRKSLLNDEVRAWAHYWGALLERTASQDKIGDLRRAADAASTMLRVHKEICPVISQNFKCAVFWKEVSGYTRKDQESDNDGATKAASRRREEQCARR